MRSKVQLIKEKAISSLLYVESLWGGGKLIDTENKTGSCQRWGVEGRRDGWGGQRVEWKDNK